MLCVARFIKRAQVSVWAPHSDRLLNQFQAPANVRPYYLASSLSLSLYPFLSVYTSETHTHIHVYAAHTLQDCQSCWLPGRQDDRRTKMRPGTQLARISMPSASLSDSRCILRPKVICISTPSATFRAQVKRDCSWRNLLKGFKRMIKEFNHFRCVTIFERLRMGYLSS